MASNYEDNYSTERILDADPISDINIEDGRRSSPSLFRFSPPNELIIEGRPTQDSSESNDSDSEGFMSDSFRININGTRFHFLREFHMVFDKLFYYSGFIVESPFNPKEILREHLKYRNCFVEHKRIRESMESITSTQRIVTHILSIMPAHARQKLAGRIPTKDLAPRPKTGPSGCSARRSHPPPHIVSYFFSYFMGWSESIRNPSIYSEDDEFPRQWTKEEQLQVKDLKSAIGKLTNSVLEDLKIVNDIADKTLRQYESGDALDLEKTLNYLEIYQADKRDYGTKEEIFEVLALMVADDCEKYLQSTFKILDLRKLLNIYEKSRSRIQYAIFLMKVHKNIDAEVNDISMNIRSLVRVARSFLMKQRREV